MAFFIRGDIFSQRPLVDTALLAGQVDPASKAALRPLDGRLHGLWARRAATEQDWVTARDRATLAVERRPGSVDPWFVLGAAQAELFVEKLPLGLDTRLGERGVSLSGGQRQRLAVARALLSRPRVLILDEATSALDAELEQQLKEALRGLPWSPTLVWVAHRLSTLADVDRIALIDDGRIAALGLHEELLAQSPRYRELVEHQLIS